MLKIRKVLLICALTVASLALSKNSFAEEDSDLKLFVQDGCSFCEQVLSHIDDNSIQDSIDIEILEISKNPDNKTLFDQINEECGLNTGYVPTLYHKGNCTTNAISVIEYIDNLSDPKITEDLQEVEDVNDEMPLENDAQESVNSESNTLSDQISLEESLPDIPWYAYIIILAALICLGSIAYLLIEKMKV